ncbi:helix-turn-helix transcriptional regulator [Primorskyibacter sp. S87]|uniref:helix-turn-helix transcriptional regulator n=1 Tax=Primorskyibacter sp. S87 TaxID=3415126 RepID=UPI003C7C554A
MKFDPADHHGDDATLKLMTLAQLSAGGAWQLELVHDRPSHVLVWFTRGQGVALFDGARHGIGAHNALFIPARHLMMLDVGRQGFGQALLIPPNTGITLPQSLLHLRIRDVSGQAELTALIEAMGREQNAQRPLCESALEAYGYLVAVWLRRHLDENALAHSRSSAARRLTRSYFQRLVTHYGEPGGVSSHAEALDVTPTHLNRVCRAQTGLTASALLTQRTLHAARSLLIATSVPAQDIARHLGFGSAAYFTRFIQQHCGTTPSALRKSAMSKASKSA